MAGLLHKHSTFGAVIAVMAAVTPISRPGQLEAARALGPARVCGASTLRASASLQGVMGSVVGTIVLRNEGRVACVLAGFPRVTISGRNGPVPLQQRRSSAAPSGFPVASTELVPGQASDVFVQWENLCARVSTPVRLTLHLSNGGLLGAQPYHQPTFYGGTSDPRCGQPNRSSFLLVSSFQPASGPGVVGLLAYYGLINRRDYADAYAMTVDPGATRAQFAAGYRRYT